MVEINEGEVICYKCKGSGKLIPDSYNLYTSYPRECDKCFGCGKLDWIENIVGKFWDRRILSADWSSLSTTELKTIYSYDVEKQLIEDLAKEIAKEIDEQILKGVLGL